MAAATLFQTEVQPADVRLRDYQEDAVRRICEEFDSGRMSTLLVLPTGCHDPDQGIMAFDGSIRRASDIRPGDLLMGPDSTAREVLALHEGRSEMFRVVPNKGQPFVVTGDHKLTLVRTNEKTNPEYPSEARGGEIVDVTVSEWMGWSKWRKHVHKLFRVPVEFQGADDASLFDPYLMGLILGDGCVSVGSVGITTADPEIVEYLQGVAADLEPYGFGLRSDPAGGRSRTYVLSLNRTVGRRGSILINALKMLGIWGTNSGTKFIPAAFKTASLAARYRLLAGLIDTDGSLRGSCYDYISKSEMLAHDVAFVARSVGLAAYVQSCRKGDQRGYVGTYYRVSISGHTDMIPCRVARKRASGREQVKDVLRTGFTVEPVGEGEYRGFTVDGDNRYLMDDFTVTHNCGKTYTFGYLARRWAIDRGVRTLVLAHRGELIQQASDALGNLGLHVGIEMAGHRGTAMGDPHAVIATVQTLQRKRLASWPADYFGLIVTDEAHHAVAESYQNVYDHFAGTPHLGVTATADRGDKINLGSVFESVAYEYTLLDAMTADYPGPYLCRLTVVQCNLPIDLRAIRTTCGDLNAADLEEVIRPHVEQIANATKHEIGDRSALVFTPDVGSAMAIATALQSINVNAAWVAGDDPDRPQKIRDYKEGRITVLCSCSLLTEGFDAPRTSAIVLCRPTKSRALFAQMIGRGTRLFPGKSDCLIIDFDWISGRHQLVKPVELLSARLTEDDEEEDRIRRLAAKLMQTGEEPDLLDAIEKAKKDIADDEARRREIRLRVDQKGRDYRRVQYDPLAAYKAVGMPKSFPSEARPQPATDKQKDALRRMGVPGVETLSKRRAGMMLDVLISRIKEGKSSYKQTCWMIANGIDPTVASAMSFQEASAELDRIFGRGRMRA